MANKSAASHKVVASNLADDGVLENLIETEGVDDHGDFNEQRILEDPNEGYVQMTNQREEIGHLIPEEEEHLFQEQEFVDDPNTNYVTVSIEELQAAGIDMDNISELTEEQIQTLLSISQQNRRSTAAAAAGHSQHFQSTHGSTMNEFAPSLDHFPRTSDGNTRPVHTRQRRLASQAQPMVGQPAPVPTSALTSGPSTSHPVAEAPPNQITITITDEGHIKLTDAANQTFFFSREDLALRNIDAKNLTDKNIQDIIQMALPSLDVGRNHGPVPPQKRRRIETTIPIPTEEPIYSHNIPLQNGAASGPSISSATMTPTHRLTPTRGGSTLAQYMPNLQPTNKVADSMILGEEVEVTKNGQTSMAIVRYCRPGAGYKVQYPDGHFEWVSENQISKRSGISSPGKGRPRVDATSPFRPSSSQAIGSQLDIRKKTADVIGAAGVGRRIPPPIPGIKLGPTPTLRPTGPQNFYCSVCDKHVCQQEPAYIILRLPACSTCADEKIVILDEEDEDTESGIEESDSQHEAPQIETQSNQQSEIRGIRVTATDENNSSKNPNTQSEPLLARNMDDHGFPANALTEEENHASQEFGNEQTDPGNGAQESQLQRIDLERNISHESFLEETPDSFIGGTLP